MKTLALFNIKGGVGKTAAAVNLSYLAARTGARTLIWDLDPQGAATFYFRIKPEIKGGIEKVIKKKKDVGFCIRETDFENLDLLPADFSNRYFDLLLAQTGKPSKGFRKILAPFEKDYTFLFLDCPPSMSLVSEAIFSSADLLIVPVIPTTLSLRTFEQLLQLPGTGRSNHGVRIFPFFSMVDRRKKLHRDIVEDLSGQMENLLESSIPYSSAVERMGLNRSPVVSYAPRERAALAYESLWEEIQRRAES